jgi:hypothetical protein|tara:strand:+ start:182 stop:298 length:117 start_codon:yes stop_codon:yes gene_type:complete
MDPLLGDEHTWLQMDHLLVTGIFVRREATAGMEVAGSE